MKTSTVANCECGRHIMYRETSGKRVLAYEEYFVRLGRRVAQLLATTTSHGFVYRVDLRLRPFGESGPLVVSFGAFEDYLQKHGRDWERYAYVKARPLTGESRYPALYRDVLRPFVYRRYLDFGVFESLRGSQRGRASLPEFTGEAAKRADLAVNGGATQIRHLAVEFGSASLHGKIRVRFEACLDE